jgi:uncharacterized membrane protein (GlpM family)
VKKPVDIRLLPLYFLIGGIVVAATTYFGSHSKGLMAAFLAFLPSISVVTLCSIYLGNGTDAALSYAKGMLFLLPPWVLYIIAVIFLLPRLGLALSLIISVAVYVVTAFLVTRLV